MENSEFLSNQNKEKLEMEIENENIDKPNACCVEDMHHPLFLLPKKEKSPMVSNFFFQENEFSQRGLKKMELENDDRNDENEKYWNFDKISLSIGDQEEGVEVFIDSKNNKTYKFVDEMTFECDEL